MLAAISAWHASPAHFVLGTTMYEVRLHTSYKNPMLFLIPLDLYIGTLDRPKTGHTTVSFILTNDMRYPLLNI